MKYYLEIIEDFLEEEVRIKQPQTLRIEVADKAEAQSEHTARKGDFDGRAYTAKYHICKHYEQLPCVLESIGEREMFEVIGAKEAELDALGISIVSVDVDNLKARRAQEV